ncbi:MAG: LysR family transcriptional regulator [Archangium sp.]|nr:LysR family transcriptional regulator [Archangium sp.]
MSISVESLKCFAEAARVLNFRAAARAVALSPAALGQRIRQLEDQLGTSLFHRTTRAVVLTEAGLRLLPHALAALEAVEVCRRAGSGDLAPTPMELVVGTRHELGLSWLVPMLQPLETALPGVTLHLYFGSGEDMVARVRSLAIDCAVTSTRLVDPKLDGIRLHDERYAFVGNTAALKRAPLKTAADAKRHTLFDTTEALPLFRYWRDAPGPLDSLDFGRVVRLGTIAAIRQQVLRGLGVAVLPAYFIDGDVKAKRLTKLFPSVEPLHDAFRLVFRADDPRRSLFTRLAAHLASAPLT